MKDTPPDGVIRIEVEEISKRSGNDFINTSPEVIAKGVPWKSAVFSKQGILGCGLVCMHNQLTPWSITVDTEFVLVHPGIGDNITVEHSHKFTNNELKAKAIVRTQNLFIDKKFINDDKIVLEIRFWISNIRGIKHTQHIDFTDPNEPCHTIALIIEGVKVYASKEILGACSPVFKAMFYGDFAEKNKSEIELKDVKREEFIELLRVIYPSNRMITHKSNGFLLKLADRFQIECVTERLEKYMIEGPMADYHTLFYADKYRLLAVQEHVISKLDSIQDVKAIEESSYYRCMSDEMKSEIRERKAHIERQSSANNE